MDNQKNKRARRRRDLARKRQQARLIYPHDPKAKNAEHMKVCSCWMCGNPRRWGKLDGLTIHERRIQAVQSEGDDE